MTKTNEGGWGGRTWEGSVEGSGFRIWNFGLGGRGGEVERSGQGNSNGQGPTLRVQGLGLRVGKQQWPGPCHAIGRRNILPKP